MTLAVGHFERAAAQLSARAAELLSAHVTVVDEHGLMVAHSLAGNGAPDGAGGDARAPYLRVPLRFSGRQGEVIVSEPIGPEPLSPRLAEALIELMITQAAVISRLPNQYELKDKFIHDLLLGAIADESDILREAQILGMDL
jgi:carbohydrate diacid regulator